MSMLESKLLAALANLGNAAGSDLVSNGVSPPPDELVKAFEDAMQNLDSGTNPEANNAAAEQAMPDEQNLLPGPAEEIPSLTFENKNTLEVNHVQESEQIEGLDSIDHIQDTNKSQEVEWKNNRQEIQDFTFQTEQTQNLNISEVKSDIKTDSSNKAPQPDELGNELQSILDKLSQPGNNLSHLDLYRAQYIMGMLKMQAQTGMKVSQGVSQGLESALKQNG